MLLRKEACRRALVAACRLGLVLLLSNEQPLPSAAPAGKVQRPQRQLLDLLRSLAEAGRHPAAPPFVLRTLQPLLAAGGCSAAAAGE